MAATLQQISAAAGVSTRTVSRILQGPSDAPHRSETRDRVLAAARKLGYRPNAAARAARTGRFNAVAMLLGRRQEQTYLRTGLLDGVYDVLERHDQHLILARIPDEELTDEQYVPKMLREWMADGVLVNYVYGFPARMVELIDRYDLPCVWINDHRADDCIYVDNLGASQVATRKLLELGHQRIAYASLSYAATHDLSEGHYAAADRWKGYEQAMRDTGLTPGRLSLPSFADRNVWAGEIAAQLRSPDRPTAIIAATENDAASVLLGAAMAGLSVPRDLSIVTYAGGLSSTSGCAIDTMALDRPRMGVEAARMLLQKIENPRTPQPSMAIRFEYRPGSTLGPVSPTSLD